MAGTEAGHGGPDERTAPIRLLLINPCNPLVSLTHVRESYWNHYRVWKPLGLAVLAALTPPEWEITIFDENVRVPDYGSLPCPDLVGITAFTSQAQRVYEVAAEFRRQGVPVVMGGIHATMCPEEALARVDAVVTGEAELVWAQVLADVRQGALRPRYAGAHANMAEVPPARHDLLSREYVWGAIQTTRGCPLSCSFCSVTAFNGHRYRQRPIADVVREFGLIREKHVLIVDDNLIGTRAEHIARAKDLFRAMSRAELRKRWIAQVTINMADDEELLSLAARAGCAGVFIGFETLSAEGLRALGGIAGGSFPEDWKYYTLTFPVARYQHFSCGDILREMETCDGIFYSRRNILRRVWGTFWQRRQPLITLAGNLSYRSNLRMSRQACRDFLASRAPAQMT